MNGDSSYDYIWRCAKCSCHFSNIIKVDGVLKQEKKCSKCKALNILSLTKEEIAIVCRIVQPGVGSYHEEIIDDNHYQEESP